MQDITGQTFNHLTALKFAYKKGNQYYWTFKCNLCGKEHTTLRSNVVKGSTKSCGCSKNPDLTGKKIGKLTILEKLPYKHSNLREKGNLWKCQCECGNIVELTTSRLKNQKSCGCLKVSHKNYIRRTNLKQKDGYTLTHLPSHPRSNKSGMVFSHIIIMEKHLNRYLLPEETVHHKNSIRDDNRIENLELWASRHPKGQRVTDLIEYAKEILELYSK